MLRLWRVAPQCQFQAPAGTRFKSLKSPKPEPPAQWESPFPVVQRDGTLEGSKLLEEAKPYEPVVVRNTDLVQRYKQYLESVKKGFLKGPVAEVPFGQFDLATSRRCGCIGVKVGIVPMWDKVGNLYTLTALWIPNVQVVGHLNPKTHGKWGVMLGAGWPDLDAENDPEGQRKLTRVMRHRAIIMPWKKLGVERKHVVHSFEVSEDAMLPVGHWMDARHFVPGQAIDVRSRTKDRGFTGVMRRWGFKGQPTSLGHSKSHRSPGSIGIRGHGKVWKGKKMAGFMGREARNSTGHYVHAIDYKNNVVFVTGSLPGKRGQYVRMQDSATAPPKIRYGKSGQPPPYPTFVPESAEVKFKIPDEQSLLVAPPRWPYNRDEGGAEFGVEKRKTATKRS